MKPSLLLLALSLLSAAPAMASKTTGDCEQIAIDYALATAPGVDESSPATLLEIKLEKTEVIDANKKIEKYYVKTEDQGGAAASIISVEVLSLSATTKSCEVIDQQNIE